MCAQVIAKCKMAFNFGITYLIKMNMVSSFVSALLEKSATRKPVFSFWLIANINHCSVKVINLIEIPNHRHYINNQRGYYTVHGRTAYLMHLNHLQTQNIA